MVTLIHLDNAVPRVSVGRPPTIHRARRPNRRLDAKHVLNNSIRWACHVSSPAPSGKSGFRKVVTPTKYLVACVSMRGIFALHLLKIYVRDYLGAVADSHLLEFRRRPASASAHHTSGSILNRRLLAAAHSKVTPDGAASSDAGSHGPGRNAAPLQHGAFVSVKDMS